MFSQVWYIYSWRSRQKGNKKKENEKPAKWVFSEFQFVTIQVFSRPTGLLKLLCLPCGMIKVVKRGAKILIIVFSTYCFSKKGKTLHLDYNHHNYGIAPPKKIMQHRTFRKKILT